MNRYRRDQRIRGGKCLATNDSITRIREAIRVGSLRNRGHTLKENERLDTLAARFLGDSSLWWVLAATSNIGWGLQAPPGTQIYIPLDLEKLFSLV